MKTKLVSIALLIPTVVLAQPASPPQQQAVMPSSNANPAPPVNPAKAATALSTAKQLSAKLKGDLSSDGSLHCPKGSYTRVDSGDSYCTNQYS